uniref:IPT/TIG domain-containing protein n=1 Tax=Romanomermis culicivorax TaxID=13658 RepID=A0A915L4W7_ROMCU
GGEKILITGENFKSDFKYECLFADQITEAHYVQSGVLKCLCPPHDAQSVSLFVHCINDGAFSLRLTFTYKNRQSNLDQAEVLQRKDHFVPKYASKSYWLDGEETNFLRGLSERLKYLLDICTSGSELQSTKDFDLFKSYASNNYNADLLEADLLKVFSLISPKMLKRPDTDSRRLNRKFPHHYGLTFAHLVARLGYDKLLIHFADYAESSSDFSFKNVDAFDRTPLVWACLYNKIPSAVFLSKFSSESLLKNDRIHRKLPLSVSYEKGYFNLLQK